MDVNLAGEATGRLYLPGINVERAFRFSNGVTTQLGRLPSGNSAMAYAIADDGTAVGYSYSCFGDCYHAVLWKDNTPVTLDLPRGPRSEAFDVSDSGSYICGWMGSSLSPHFGGAHAFIWHAGKVIDLGTPLPGSDSTEAKAVNNLGNACGNAHFAEEFPTGFTRGFYWSTGNMVDWNSPKLCTLSYTRPE